MRTVRLKYLFGEIDQREPNDGSRPLLAVSIHRGVEEASAEVTGGDSNYKICQAGDLVINRMRAFQGSLGIAPIAGLVSPDYAVLRTMPDVSARFLSYLLRSRWGVGAMAARIRGIGGTENGNVRTPRINVTDLGEITAAIPELGAQHEIADFLDRECLRIDELIATTDGAIACLDEHRSDAVRSAVAGLHHGPLKFGFTVVDCKHRTPDYLEAGFPVISTREVERGALDLSSVARFVSDEDYADLRDGGRDPLVGDIVYSRNASLGVAAYVRDPVDICMGQDVVLISRRPRTSELLAYMLNYAVADQVEQLSVGSTFSRINVPVIRSLVVPYDMPDREAAALDSIREAFGRLGELEVAMKALVRGLREYRDALITEAVSGKLPVPA